MSVGIKAKIAKWLVGIIGNNYMPKWAVFLVDCVLIAASFFMATFIWQSFTLDFSTNPTFQYLATAYIGILVLSTLVFRTFSGIIRFSSVYDTLRLVVMSVVGGVAFYVINIRLNLVEGNFKYYEGIIVFWVFSTFCLLFSFRKAVRFTYSIWQNKKDIQKRTILLFNDEGNADFVKYMLSDSRSSYIPVVLLDKTGKLDGKRISNIPIISYKGNIGDIAHRYRAKTLLVLRNDLSILNGLSEDCLNNDIEMVVSEISSFDGNVNFSSNVHRIQIDDLLNRDVIERDTKPLEVLFYHRTVLVTGGAGSIGSEIVRQLCKYKCRVVIYDSAESPLHAISLEIAEKYPNTELTCVIGDVRNLKKLERTFEEYKPDIVFHAAAYKHVPLMEDFPEEAILANVLGSKNVADLSVKFGVKKMVMVSTDKAVNPTNVMGASKRIAEQYVNALFSNHLQEGGSTKTVTTRFGNVLGSNGSVVPIFKKQIAKGGPITITHKDIIRYFMTIPEACSLVLEAASMGNGGEVFVFDMGKPVKIYDLAVKMILLAGLKPNVDIKIVETGLRPGEKLFEELLTSGENTLPTYNDKIMVAKVDVMPLKRVSSLIENLINEANNGNSFEVVRIMKEIVPEYKSKNSIFESLDSSKSIDLLESVLPK